MKIFVVGANTISGKHLIHYILNSNHHEARAFVQNSVQSAYFSQQGVETVIIDPTQKIQEVALAMRGIHAMVIVGSLYVEPQYPIIEIDDTIRLIEAAQYNGVKRFIHMSYYAPRQSWTRLPRFFRAHLVESYYINQWLKLSKSDYTILHTGTLTDQKGTGLIDQSLKKEDIPREDVAKLILTCLENEETIYKEFIVTSGETPIEQLEII